MNSGTNFGSILLIVAKTFAQDFELYFKKS